MPRKGHKKSRLGCAECKKRHVKCDETRPSCVNCKTAEISCSYANKVTFSASAKQASSSASHSHSHSPLNDGNVGAVTSLSDFNDQPILAIPFRAPSDTFVNFAHLELLYNFQSETFRSFVINETAAAQYMNTAIRQGLQHPFLMYALLALSSLHLSIQRPERMEFYRQQSSDLQALAVQGFNEIMTDVNEENYIAVFLFSSLMGLHAFCDTCTFRAKRSDFSLVLDQFTDSMKLMRGMLVVMNGYWEALHQSELREVVADGNYRHIEVSEYEECKPLKRLVEEADLSATTKEAYEKTVTELQRGFNAQRLIVQNEKAIRAVFGWAVTANETYITALQQRRPEALVIMAFYGVLLHRKRNVWAVQDAGKYLINAIRNYLGAHWRQWLAWPLSAVSADDGSSSSQTPSSSAFYSPGSFPT